MQNPLKLFIEKLYLLFDDNLVYYDSTTRCKSRFYYDEIISKQYRHRECKIIYIDIDNLKKINDTFGHFEGTLHIKNIAMQLRNLENVKHVCRIGGDEFVMICSIDFDDKLMAKIKGISYGIVHKRKYEDFDYSIRKADEKMYRMKRDMK